MRPLALHLVAALCLTTASCGSQTSAPNPGEPAFTATALDAGLVCNKAGGSWRIDPNGNAAQQMQFSTAAERPLPAPVVTACGSVSSTLDVYENFGGGMNGPDSLGVTYDLNTANSTFSTGEVQYFWSVTSNNVSVGVWFKTDLPASNADYLNYASMLFIGNSDGSDFASLMVHRGDFYLETGGNQNGPPDVGSFFPYTANKWYWVTEQFQAHVNSTSMHSLAIDDCGTPQAPILPCSQLSLQKKFTVTTATAKPLYFSVGKAGDNGSPPNFVYYDELLGDTTGQTFPILP